MIVTAGEIKMVRRGRRWLEFKERPNVGKLPRVIRLRSSKNQPGLVVTADRLVRYEDRWRLLVRVGDCLEHLKLLVPSTGPGTGVAADLGYTEDYWRAMQDEPEAMV